MVLFVDMDVGRKYRGLIFPLLLGISGVASVDSLDDTQAIQLTEMEVQRESNVNIEVNESMSKNKTFSVDVYLTSKKGEVPMPPIEVIVYDAAGGFKKRESFIPEGEVELEESIPLLVQFRFKDCKGCASAKVRAKKR